MIFSSCHSFFTSADPYQTEDLGNVNSEKHSELCQYIFISNIK